MPGSIQPRGVLLVLREPEMVVVQASANLPEVLGVEVDAVLGNHLSSALGDRAGRAVVHFASSYPDLRHRNPLEVVVHVGEERRDFDAILSREPDGLLLVELEDAYGPRPFSFPNTYQAVRGATQELNTTAEIQQLYDVTARAVRELTGFDRVMVYRYDEQYNGEVVAEAKLDDLNSFLGLHYPASDIPAQARALYEKNWIRLIHDVDYTPSPLVPAVNPVTGGSIDLTNSTLRSVSPIHLEYLRNMGVHASMSISLLREGKLWGLIACHHYSGPHSPPYGTRAAAEFLGSTLSLRLVDRVEDDNFRARIAAQAVLAKLTATTNDERTALPDALLGAPDLLDLIEADGVVVGLEDELRTRGTVPDERAVLTIVEWARSRDTPVAATESLRETLPELDVPHDVAAGALVVVLPDRRYLLWTRAEQAQSVDWGGDPYNKAIATREGDSVRLSPRKSFERWTETVRNRSAPWSSVDRDHADQLRRVVVEAMFQRASTELRLAETLQRNLQPRMPDVAGGWHLSAHYEPAEGGRVGGDWYDALYLPDGRLAAVLGDVAGHGIAAAGTMAQLRNVLRAYLHDGDPVAEAVAKANRFATQLLPGAFATLAIAAADLDTGEVEAVSAGHPLPFLLAPGAEPATPAIVVSPPVGIRRVDYRASTFTMQPGQWLVLFSDGLIERRGEVIDVGRQRLSEALASLSTWQAPDIREAVDRDVADDATIVSLGRPSR
ncbi:hypothetical protein GCM10027265_07050 [Jatrophihabitans fulvus]